MTCTFPSFPWINYTFSFFNSCANRLLLRNPNYGQGSGRVDDLSAETRHTSVAVTACRSITKTRLELNERRIYPDVTYQLNRISQETEVNALVAAV